MLADKALAALRFAITAEPHLPGIAAELSHPVLKRFAARLADPSVLEQVSAIVGTPVNSVDCRALALQPDGPPVRVPNSGGVVFDFCLSQPSACTGGALQIGDTHVEVKANRLSLFATAPVRHPVTSGSRIALVGVFSR